MRRGGFTRTAVPLENQFASLLKASLETWAHQVLYTRRVYPSSTFCATTVWGVRCRACRAKQVVEYIHDSIETGITALMKGTATSLSLVIIDDPNEDDGQADNIAILREEIIEKERLTISFAPLGEIRDLQTLRQAERLMRDLIIRTQALPDMSHHNSCRITNSTSFQLIWHLQPSTNNDKTNPLNQRNDYGDIPKAFDNGTWIEDRTSKQGDAARIRRPLFHSSSACLQINFYSQVTSKKKPPGKQGGLARKFEAAAREDPMDF